MSDAVQTRLLAAVLAALGLGIFLVKVVGYDMPLLALPEGSPLPEQTMLNPLTLLPPDVQDTFRVMVLVPLGILLLVFLRQFVGIATIGTFMPVLIGVSFRETGPVVGTIVFTLLVIIGLVVRMYFEKLRLLLVPRLAAVLVVVVMAIILLAVGFAQLDIDIGSSASLFPLVILAMTIERMAIAWEELSPRDAILKGIGSLFIAIISHFLMTNSALEHVFYSFPELLFVVLAVMLLMGKYTGYRLSELIRFREIAKS
ncbi:MAG: 7TM domain-containing protein [Pseudomonadota bacterium]